MQMLGPTRVTAVDGTPIAWTEIGDHEKPPIVLIHGIGDSHRTWRFAAPKLAEHHRVIMVDMPGHGLSGRPDAPYTLDWYAKMMIGWLDAVGIERAHVVAHSYGGGVAQWMMLQDRARIERLVLVAPGGLGPEVSLGLRLASIPVVVEKFAQPFMGPCTRVMMHVALGKLRHPSPEDLAYTVWANTAPGTGVAFARTVSGVIDVFGQHKQTWDRIAEVESLPPIAVIWGDRDRIVPIEHAYGAQQRIEGASFTPYADVGHFPHIEASERFAGDVLGFLDEGKEPVGARYVAIRAPRRSRVRRLIARVREWLRRPVKARVERERKAPRESGFAAAA